MFKKLFKNQHGFTLIEMLIVLMIISVLIILIVPNLGEKSEHVNEKGCEALVELVQAQVDAYYIENGSYPSSLTELVSNGFIEENQQTCTNGTALILSADGSEVSIPTPSE
ncbi:competence type IV pilus major pilin ComGC [Virgibacillus siamensis]|uniref:competence type IV pilus major pilin ComGC n=1 Tax=Virgibacillus siamensis TaxID=480071 RepID=UPI000985A250|nr:competence type IV pilus major pilin ComGC [Virgibacillus siamensis]